MQVKSVSLKRKFLIFCRELELVTNEGTYLVTFDSGVIQYACVKVNGEIAALLVPEGLKYHWQFDFPLGNVKAALRVHLPWFHFFAFRSFALWVDGTLVYWEGKKKPTFTNEESIFKGISSK